MRCFGLAAPKHHADEEDDFFPALFEAVAGSDALCLRGLVDRLQADYRSLEHQWDELRAILARIAVAEPAVLTAERVEAFVEQYADHIAVQEGEVLPMAERFLSDEAIAALGAAMRRRRLID
ncbi:hemerythrin domain-containing protein [Roseateles sp. P5_E7]